MPVRTANAEWKGNLREGSGTMKLPSGAYEGPYTFASRFEEGQGSNPEELIAAAHAGCFSMFLSNVLAQAGFTPTSVRTTAKVTIVAGQGITKIELDSEAQVPGIDEAKFQEAAENAKQNCPVSKALGAVSDIQMNAKLV